MTCFLTRRPIIFHLCMSSSTLVSCPSISFLGIPWRISHHHRSQGQNPLITISSLWLRDVISPILSLTVHSCHLTTNTPRFHYSPGVGQSNYFPVILFLNTIIANGKSSAETVVQVVDNRLTATCPISLAFEYLSLKHWFWKGYPRTSSSTWELARNSDPQTLSTPIK